MKNKYIFTMISLLFLTFSVIGQKNHGQSSKLCGSNADLESMKNTDPERYARFIKMEEQINRFRSNQDAGFQGRLINTNSVIIIPVIVHVLHNGESIGTGNNISDAQIQSQIDVLNEDFRRLNADAVNTPMAFAAVASDPGFEFRLACIDPNGNSTTGIHRIQTTKTVFNVTFPGGGAADEVSAGIKFSSLGGTDAWPTNTYLNIWVCNLGLIGPLQLLGYAQFPADYSSKPNTDGIVVHNAAFGVTGASIPGNMLGRTATHEIGHWLDLRHIWGDDGTACTGSDFCNDTPNQGGPNGAGPIGGCPAFPTISCSNGPNGDMFMNYMDYTEDQCKNIFTSDQRIRMRAVFAEGNVRNSFIENYFHVNPRTDPICATGTVSVTNPGCVSPVTWGIVSGPASIIGGQGTNTVTLQTTGNGIAIIQATAGGYVDEITVEMGTQTPGDIIGLDRPTPVLSGDVLTLYADKTNMTSYSWSVVGGTISGASNEDHVTINVDYCYPPLYNSYINVYLTYSNVCGTGSEYGDWTYVLCSEGGGPLRIAISPNPVKGSIINLTVSGGKITNTKLPAGEFSIRLYDIATKKIVKEWHYPAGLPNYRLSTVGIKPSHYIIEVIRGAETQTKHILIE